MKSVCVLMMMTVLSSFGVEWKTSEIDGEDFVSMEQVGEFYKLKRVGGEDGKFFLKNKDLTLSFEEGSKVALFNGVKFQLTHSVTKKEASVFLSATDLKLILDPVLRPRRVKGVEGFKIVLLDPVYGQGDAGKDALVQAMVERGRKRGFEVVVMEGEEMTLENKLKKAAAEKKAIYLQLVISEGKERAIRTSTLGSNTGAGLAVGTAVHWGIHQRWKKERKPANPPGDEGISVGGKTEFDKLELPGVRVELTFGADWSGTKGDSLASLLGNSIVDSLFFARKAAGRQAKIEEEK